MSLTKVSQNLTSPILVEGSTNPRTLEDRFADVVNVLDFIPVAEHAAIKAGTSTYDATADIQAAIDFAHTNNKSIFVPSGNYFISSQINKPQSFNCPHITGEGYRKTIFNFTSSIGLKIKGGSGQASGAVISNIGFNGLNTTTLVQVADQCGLTFRDCKFNQSSIGIELLNESINGFTEFVVAENCEFTSLSNKSLVYRKTSGNESFHGSGLRNCIINENSSATNANIEIGSGCLVYNAPMSFQIWKKTTQPIISHLGSILSYVHGNITVELFGGAVGNRTELVSGPTNLYLIGNIQSLGQYTDSTYVVFCNRVQINNDGTLNADKNPKISKFDLTTGSNNISYFQSDESTLFQITLVAPNYEYSYLLLVYGSPTSAAGSVNTIATMRSFDIAGYGAPTFSFSNSRLVVDNPNFPASGVTAYCKSTYLGTRWQFRMG